MVFYRKETDIMKFENEFKCAFCSSSQGFMLKCDHYQCKNQAHPFCINEERRAMAAKNDGAASTWQILHKDSVSDNCKAIPDRQGLGIIGYEGSELVEDYRSNKWKRGGLISFFCEIHRQLDEYCICGSQEDESQSSFMIECEA